MNWTPEQQKVIDARNKNILVSAAAGSGKTAVLVERIIQMITDHKKPVDIDRLLIVTFTNAAAAQMREKIGKAIEEKLKEQPQNHHLQKQVTLLPSAFITTIHSFCLNVIRNYFNEIDLDPSFKLADEVEITLMKSDVITEVLEQYYEEGSEDFHAFIESYSYSKSDAPIEELVLQLFQFAMSYPWPTEWLMEKQKVFDISTMEEFNSSKWMQELIRYLKGVMEDLCFKNEQAIDICNQVDGPNAYLSALVSDRELLNKMHQIESYSEYGDLLTSLSFARLSNKKEEGVLLEKKEQVKALREEIKKGLKDLKNQFFFQTPMEMLKDLQAVKAVMKSLFDVTLSFMEAFAKKKEEKNIIDFNDLEHFALKILVSHQDGEIIPSVAAMELSEHFEEILIDEYQDSNLVQETILKSISRERIGRPNRFMVGDVKQSIYKFRLAMPELFMEKYDTYGVEQYLDDGELNPYQRIDLDKNFRSRKVVLDYVNKIFEQIMIKSVGGVVYNEAAALKYGLGFDHPADLIQESDKCRIAEDVELILITEQNQRMENNEADQVEENSSEDSMAPIEGEEEEIYTKRELEARGIAKRIKELVNPNQGMLVYDKEVGYRPAHYGDIVILLRSMSGWSEVFVNTLMQEGIPAYADTTSGYFQTIEITTILNFLRIVDNPRQDIPFVGALYSPMVGINSTELAHIRACNRNESMYQSALSYAMEGDMEELKAKLNQFFELLNGLREMVNYTTIHELILLLLDRTGYYYYVSAMPAGDRRKANIDLLISHAVRFEKGSYSGLFHFIRYIEKLHKYEVDFGEAITIGEQDNTVRIMSIHKSKGLEFPIVFVAGLSKQFNTQDLRSKLVLHAEFGVGPEYIDTRKRTKVPTLLKKMIQKKVQIENLGEELRILYVAMTRAKEKLIMTAYQKENQEYNNKSFSFYEIVSASSYLDWVYKAMLSSDEVGMKILHMEQGEFLKEEVNRQIFQQLDKESLLSYQPGEVYDEAIKEEINTRFSFVYPYDRDTQLKVKMSVSELKKLGQQLDQELSEILYTGSTDVKEINTYVPNFIQQKEALTSADKGVLYHKVLELIDLSRLMTKEEIMQELLTMVEKNHLSDVEQKKLNVEHIYRFLHSDIAARMRKAKEQQKLYKEKQFVIGIKASEVKKEYQSDELILVQGIVDAFFEEDNELVLVDYKSDYITEKEEFVLVQRYQVQLDYYQKALEQILKKKVKEKIIYSLHLGKEIRID